MKGGSERYYFTLANTFKKMGHQVIFFAMHDAKNEPCYQSPFFVSSVGVNGGIKSKLKLMMHISYSKEAYNNMKALLIKENPDLVILNLVHKQITCSIIDAIKEFNPKLPIVWTMHDLICVCPAYTMLDGKGNMVEDGVCAVIFAHLITDDRIIATPETRREFEVHRRVINLINLNGYDFL